MGLLLVGLIFACLGAVAPAASLPASNLTLEYWVETTVASAYPTTSLVYTPYVGLLYRQTGFHPFWRDRSGQPSAAARALSERLQPWLALEDHPKIRLYTQLDQLLNHPVTDPRPRYRQAHDLLITDLFLRFQDDLLRGYWTDYDRDTDHQAINLYERWDGFADEVVPRHLEEVFPQWFNELQQLTPAQWIEARLADTQPLVTLYRPWRAAFDQLQQQLRLDPWPQLEAILLERGSADAQVAMLVQQLLALGDLEAEDLGPLPTEGWVLDSRIEAALKNFQRRHGLPVTGQTDAATRRWLNLAPSERLRIVAHNLRRLHHLPQTLQTRHLMINLADQQLVLVEQEEPILTMRVIIGGPDQRTPIMNQWLTSLILNPLWNVPNSIAVRTILPRARNNPNYLATRDYALVEGWQEPIRWVELDALPDDAFTQHNTQYRLVQRAGPFNQLGHAKFRLSNQQAIYLHDTPDRHLFTRSARHLSSGCVRLEDSARLVEALLAPQWTPTQIQAIYATGSERHLRLHPRVAVYLMYWTAWTDVNGQLQWREDIYQKDRLTEHGVSRAKR